MATENSVIASLNEVRRLERERVRREQEAASRREAEERSRRDVELRAWEATPGRAEPGPAGHGFPGGPDTAGWGAPDLHGRGGHPRASHDPYAGFGPRGAPRRTEEFGPVGAGYGAPAAYDLPYGADAAPLKPRTSWTAAFVMTFLCVGAAAAGFWKLNQDFQQKIIASERARFRAEEARNQAVEEKVRAERTGQDKLAACETKMAGGGAGATPAATLAAVVPTSPFESDGAPEAVAPASVAKHPSSDRRPRPAKKVALVEPRGKHASAPAEKPAPQESAGDAQSDKATMQKIRAAAKRLKAAQKKSVSDDPLGSLKISDH